MASHTPWPAEAFRLDWRGAAALFHRPQPVTWPMVALALAVPFYIFIGNALVGREFHVPETALDRAIPLAPAWSVVYGSLFLVAVLPAFVVHRQELIQRTIKAFLFAWLFSYAVFVAYPTYTPRPEAVIQDGFFTWVLVAIYSTDVEYNCFPSLHVAQAFLAAFACDRVHRGVGKVAFVWAALVALSTLLTKQHYVLDVVAGTALAWVGYAIFIRAFPRESVTENERRHAPTLALAAFTLYGLVILGAGIAYAVKG